MNRTDYIRYLLYAVILLAQGADLARRGAQEDQAPIQPPREADG